MKFVDMQSLANEIHEENLVAGWWEPYPNKIDRFQTCRILVASELCECLEGWRKDLMDDHLPQYPMVHVEVGDALIRLLDMGRALEIDFTVLSEDKFHEIIKGSAKDLLDMCSVPEQLDVILAVFYDINTSPTDAIRQTIMGLLSFAEMHQIHNIWEIIDEKRVYNRGREDHKIETRKGKHGKKI